MADDPVTAFLAAHKAQPGTTATIPRPKATADPVAAFLSAHSATPAAPAPDSTPAPQNAPTDPVAAFLGTHKAASSGNPFAPVGNAAKTVATGVGNALDAQRWAVAKALTGKSDTGEQRTAEREAVGTQGIYDAIGKIPGVGHALQGASDVVQDTLTDPLTAETLGAGPVLKALGLADKLAVGTARVGKAITDTPAGALLHDTLNWGGEVTRTHGKSTTNTIRGALNKASTTGAQTTAEYKRLSQGIIDGLSDDEKMNVRKALNGEMKPPEAPPPEGSTPLMRGDLTGSPGERNLLRKRGTLEAGDPERFKKELPQGAPFYFFTEGADAAKQYAGAADRALDGWRQHFKASAALGGEKLTPDEIEKRSQQMFKYEYGTEPPTGKVNTYHVTVKKPLDLAHLGEKPDFDDTFEALQDVHTPGWREKIATMSPEEQKAWWRTNGVDSTMPHINSRATGRDYDKLPVWRLMRNLEAGDTGAQDFHKWVSEHGYDGIKYKENGTTHTVALKPDQFVPESTLEAQRVMPLNPKERAATDQLRALTERDYAERTKTMMAQKYNEVADRLSPEHQSALKHALATGERPADGQLADVYDSLQHQTKEAMPYRQDYAPTVHKMPEAGEEGRAATPRTAGEQFDTRNLQRESVPTTEPGQLREGFDALSTNAGRMASKRVVQESLGSLMDDPAVKKLITDTGKATGNARTNVQKVGDTWLKIIGYPRAATVSLTPRHAANIIDLAANTVPPAQFPGYMKNVTALTAKLIKASPEEQAELLKDGRDLGAISQDFAEHQPFFQNVPGLKHWTAANNKLVWAIDSASKQEYAKLIKAAHPEMSDLEAGGQASERLVDYANKSPLVKALRFIAPFGTFRGSVPGAVVGGIARNPARAALLNRATGGTMYGGKPAKGQEGSEFYGPTSDVTRGIDAPQDFLRGTLGAPVQAAATLGGEALTGNPGASLQQTGQEVAAIPGQVAKGQFGKIGTPPKVSPYAKSVALRTSRYLDYSNPIDLRWIANAALAGVPEAGTALEQIGGSQFAIPKGTPIERIARELLRQTSGVSVR